MTRRVTYLAGASALAAIALPFGLWAQIADGEGGARFIAGLDLRLESADGDATFRTGLDVDLISATRTQRLSFSTDFGLELDLSDFDTAFTDPRYQLAYERTTGLTRLTATARYQSSDIDGFALDPNAPFDEVSLIEDDGTRVTRQLQTGFEWGLRDPLGGSVSYTFSDTAYTDTTDPSLIDVETSEWGATLRYTVDPSLTFTLDGALRRTEEDNASQDVDTLRRLGLSVNWLARPDITVDARIGYSHLEQEMTAVSPATVITDTDIEASLGITLDRPNGTLAFNWDRIQTDLGLQDTVSVGRGFAWTRDREVSAAVGMTFLPTGENFLIGTLAYGQELRNGRLALSAERSAAVGSLDDEVVRTLLAASYSGDLPRDARWSLSANYSNSDFVDPLENDVEARSLSANYAVPLTRDWDLSTGVTWRETETQGSPADDSTTLFISLQRNFVYRR